MGRTVQELLGVVESRELSEWMAFDRVEPIGGRRGDFQAAVVASTMANVFRGKGARPYTVADFMPEYGRPEEQIDPEALAMQQVAMWQAMQGLGDP